MTSAVQQALTGLDQELNQLEKVIEEKARATRSIADLRAELLIARDDIERLKLERDQLKLERDQLKMQNDNLLTLGKQSADKLDEAIHAMESLFGQLEDKRAPRL